MMNALQLERAAREYVITAMDERFFGSDGVRLFPEASVGIQRSSHGLFTRLPLMIEGHLAPGDFFRAEFPGPPPESLSVISVAFHVNPRIVEDNSRERTFPSRSWFEARHGFDSIHAAFIEHLCAMFPNCRMVVPGKTALYRADLSKQRPVANWSERHVAFACGLGSFGLHGALITPKGCTHRLLSVIVEAEMEGYAEPDDDPYSRCRHFRDGSCGECIARCPVEAIVPGEHIIERCCVHEQGACRVKAAEIFGAEVAACGLCMCGVPCSTSSPA